MDVETVSKHAAHSMTLAVLREVEAAVKALQPDPSSISLEHAVGYDAGFRACKRACLDAIASE